MKKLLFAVVALLVLAPFAGFAEPTHPNEIGLYTDSWDGYGPTGTEVIGGQVVVYLVLTIPEANNVPVSGLRGFECQLNFSPTGNLFKTGDALNGNGLNIGDINNLSNGYLEYIVGFSSEVPVVDDAILLITFSFIHIAPGEINVTLGPISTAIPSVPGQMSFVTPFQTLEVMHSMGGSHDAPVFLFGGYAVAVEDESFGSVKALFR